jgi:hypothetical protein
MSTAGWVTKTFTGKATLSKKPLKNIRWGTKNEDQKKFYKSRPGRLLRDKFYNNYVRDQKP